MSGSSLRDFLSEATDDEIRVTAMHFGIDRPNMDIDTLKQVI